MEDLDTKNIYTLTSGELEKLQELFIADYCTDTEGKGYIKSAFNDGYLMDPHTATCFKTYETLSNPAIKSIIYSTAEWTKFSPVIANALTGEVDAQDSVALEAISKEAKVKIPEMIKGLFEKKIIHDSIIEKEDIEKEIVKFL